MCPGPRGQEAPRPSRVRGPAGALASTACLPGVCTRTQDPTAPRFPGCVQGLVAWLEVFVFLARGSGLGPWTLPLNEDSLLFRRRPAFPCTCSGLGPVSSGPLGSRRHLFSCASGAVSPAGRLEEVVTGSPCHVVCAEGSAHPSHGSGLRAQSPSAWDSAPSLGGDWWPARGSAPPGSGLRPGTQGGPVTARALGHCTSSPGLP